MKTTIFIDESGTLPDTKDEVIVVAAVGTQIPNLVNQLFKQTQKQLKKGSELSEIKFDSFLGQLLDDNLTFKHVDSQQFKLVNVADMVAGATLAHIRGRNSKFHEIFKEKIISEITINWPEAKRRLLVKEKLA